MTARTMLITAALSLLPISELRGALPYAIVQGVPLPLAYAYAVLLNILVGPFVFVFMSTVHRWMLRFGWYERIIGRILERARKKVQLQVDRFGYLGLLFFVAIPLPITGAYTGAIGAWILGMNPRKSIFFIALGVVIAGVIVSTVMLLGIEALSFFVKDTGGVLDAR